METIELHGLTFGVERLHDHDANFPWNETDILGAVSDWTRRDKRPGERIINTGRVGKRFYDFAAAVRKGRAEGMKGPQAAEHAAREYQWLRDYCDDKWHYIGVRVVLLDAEGKPTIFDDALWGIESDADGHIATVAGDLASEIGARVNWADFIELPAHTVHFRTQAVAA